LGEVVDSLLAKLRNRRRDKSTWHPRGQEPWDILETEDTFGEAFDKLMQLDDVGGSEEAKEGD